ncbi:minor tail protein [Gordonia phage SpeedDemon]|nr:minor tail protein [Gordonia phage SpeedDemon]
MILIGADGANVAVADDTSGVVRPPSTPRTILIPVPGTKGDTGERGAKGDKGDPGEVTLAQLNTAVSPKLNRLPAGSTSRVYVNNAAGDPSSIAYNDSTAEAGSIARRTVNGQVVVSDPAAAGHAATKNYVDNSVASRANTVGPAAGTFGRFLQVGNPESSQFIGLAALYNDLAFNTLRGGSVTLTKNGVSTWADPNIFKPDSTFLSMGSLAPTDELVFEVTCWKAFRYSQIHGIVFPTEAWVPSNVKIERYVASDDAWTVELNTTTNTSMVVYVSGGPGGTKDVTKLRYTLSGAPAVQNTIRVSSLFAIGYDSPLLSSGFVTREGGDIFGHISRAADPTDPNHLARKSYVDSKVPRATGTAKVYVRDTGGSENTITYSSEAQADVMVRRLGNGHLAVPDSPTLNGHAASKSYVDAQATARVPKQAGSTRVYVKDTNGNDSAVPYSSSATALTMMYRTDGGVVSVGEPTASTHAATKNYVDTALTAKESTASKGQANGYAALDAGGKVPISQLPSSIMEYKGVWNASTNSPTLANGTGDTGDVYRVTTAGTRNLGGGNIEFAVGDYVVYNSSGQWEKSDTTDSVASVAGLVGVITVAGLKTALALSNVDNTRDADKPISTAVQGALNAKVDRLTEPWKIYSTSDTGLHGLDFAGNAATPWTIAQRGEGGRTKVGDPLVADDAAPKGYVDTAAASKLDRASAGVFSVRDYGAVGDGAANDQPAIMAAIAAAQAAGGGEVFFPAGAYKVASTVGTGSTAITNVVLRGAGNSASKVVAGGNFPPISGSFYRSTIKDLTVDAAGLGGPGMNLHMVESRVSGVLIDRWTTFGMVLNDGSFGDVGLLNVIDNCHIVQGTGIGIFQTYRWVDSWILNNNIGSTDANLSLEGGPIRVIGNHLDGSPLRNIDLRGNKRITISDNILEGARREAIRYVMPSWLTSDSPQIQITANNFSNGGKEAAGSFPAIAFTGVSSTARLSGLSVTGNIFACEDAGSGWSHCVKAEYADGVAVSSNQWELGYTVSPVSYGDGQHISLAGNTTDASVVIGALPAVGRPGVLYVVPAA